MSLHRVVFLLILLPLSPIRAWGADLRPDEIVTVLQKDGIPAILSPTFQEGRRSPFLKQQTPIIGVEINGDSRAYPVAILSRREIVNDKVGGIPIAVTW